MSVTSCAPFGDAERKASISERLPLVAGLKRGCEHLAPESFGELLAAFDCEVVRVEEGFLWHPFTRSDERAPGVLGQVTKCLFNLLPGARGIPGTVEWALRWNEQNDRDIGGADIPEEICEVLQVA